MGGGLEDQDAVTRHGRRLGDESQSMRLRAQRSYRSKPVPVAIADNFAANARSRPSAACW